MKRKCPVLVVILCLVVAIVDLMGVGYYSSGSARKDLIKELENIYGTEYTGKEVDDGTEDMVFVVEPKTWFLTDWNLRTALSLDYEYECNVIFTIIVDGSVTCVRTITYHAVDPMGPGNSERAHLDLSSVEEKTEYK